MIFMLSLGSCEYLEYNEEDFYKEEMVFDDFNRTKNFLNGIYGNLPSGFNEIDGSMRASASDDAEEANEMGRIHIMNDGRWSPTQYIDSKWGAMYEGIRSANRLLRNEDVSVLDDYRYNDDYVEMIEQYNLFDDQAKFLRAYFYFELMRRYGGVPLLKGKILSLDEVNSVKPNSFEEVKDFIIQECNAIIDNLPINYEEISGAPHKGRATKGSAMALKARTLLYAASPLYGSSQEEWATAAEASYAIIDSSWYPLDNNYSNVVNNTQSNELIMGRRFAPSNDFEGSNFPVGYEKAEPGTCPTQNLVNTYEMANGMDIDESGSGYDPDNPYINRDPRLKQTIIVNNSEWKDRNVEIWGGGRDGPPMEFATETGYYLKKYVVEHVSLDPDYPSSANHLWVFFRYGEVLLNYAEAMNEAYGPTDSHGYGITALEAMNQIRNRAGLPDYSGTITQGEIRREIQEERRVELAFENHRFWDVRRWMIGEETININGMEITQNQDLTFNYDKVLVETRYWNSKMYFYPIPQSELFKNSNLEQNSGW